MKTRMEKYYPENETMPTLSRSKKNEDLYKEVSSSELEEFNLNSNVSVLGENSPNLDVEKIQEILNQKYKEEPRRKTSIPVEPLPLETLELDETREYDINAILDKAKETKEVDYEVDRLKKIRNTQYDILNNLDLEPKIEDVEDLTTEQAKLMDLIHTITSKEMATQVNHALEEDTEESEDLDPLDLFSDLKGDDDATSTIGAIKEDLLEEAKRNEKRIQEENPSQTKEFPAKAEETQENSFFTTTSTQFSQSDFDDFNDLKDDMKAAKIIIKALIILVIIAFLVGCFFLVNSILGLGLF